jgi:hypothetical protein
MTEQGSRSWKARPALEAATKCGCYYCLKIYSPSKITEWCDSDQTAICPECGIDAVIPFDPENYDIDPMSEFKEELIKFHKGSFG